MDISISLNYSILLFLISAIVIWYFCNKLSTIVNYIDNTFNLGTAFGGTIMLAIVTNLPEIAITINGALKGNIDLAIGNILGGIAIQSALLILFDFASRNEKLPLSTLTSNETSILQGLFLILILIFVIIGKQFPENIIFNHSTPPEILIVFVWIISLLAIKKFQKGNIKEGKNIIQPTKLNKNSAILWFVFISIIVLFFGVVLETTSDIIATHYNINGVIFGATILAFVTSLPEISGGLAFVKNKSYIPIIDDIFGGNTFLPVLFIPAIVLTNNAILPQAKNIDIYLTCIAIVITLCYLIGMQIKLKKRYYGLGIDSWIALFIYLFSVLGLFYI